MKKKNLSNEIGLILFLKVILLFFVWYLCFSNPIDDHNVQHMTQRINHHFFNSTIGSQK